MSIKRILMTTLSLLTLTGCSHGQCKTDAGHDGRVLTVDTDEFAQILTRQNMRLLDVRTAQEYAEGHLAGAENKDVNRSDFATQCADVCDTVAVYCRSGRRSMKAARRLAAQGCTVYNLNGGIVAWRKAGKEVVATVQRESNEYK